MYAYRLRKMKAHDGRETTFRIDANRTVYDETAKGLRKVGKLSKDGTISALPKYLKRHRARLKQFEPQNKGCAGGKPCRYLALDESGKEEHSCAGGVKTFAAHLDKDEPCFSYGEPADVEGE